MHCLCGITPIRYSEKIEGRLKALPKPAAGISGSERWNRLKQVETEDDALQSEIISARYKVAEDIATRIAAKRQTGETFSDRIDYWGTAPDLGRTFDARSFWPDVLHHFCGSAALFPNGWLKISTCLAICSAVGWSSHEYRICSCGWLFDGIMKGVGATLGFLPQMAVFFLFYTLIQDSGYLVRVVFLVDRVIERLGHERQNFFAAGAGVQL